MSKPYTALAALYDRIMAHVEYDRWAAYIHTIIAKYLATTTPRLFEIGGGTGILGNILTKSGIHYYGSDYSPAMCSMAKNHCLSFITADARLLPVKKSAAFDMALFLYDGINYLHTLEDYQKTFVQVHSILKPEGLFLFDITTLENSINNFYDFIDAEDFGDYSFIRRSFFNTQDALQFNEFTIFHKVPATRKHTAAVYRKYREQHIQKVFTVKAIKDAIPPSLFDITGIWDNYSFRRYTVHSERVHFLLRKVS